MTALLILGGVVLALLLIRRTRATRAIQHGSSTQTWAQASDARFARYPRGHRLGRRRGLQ